MALSETAQVNLIAFLKENMKLEVKEGGFTDPNSREIILWIGDELICRTSIDIKQRREYEG